MVDPRFEFFSVVLKAVLKGFRLSTSENAHTMLTHDGQMVGSVACTRASRSIRLENLSAIASSNYPPQTLILESRPHGQPTSAVENLRFGEESTRRNMETRRCAELCLNMKWRLGQLRVQLQPPRAGVKPHLQGARLKRPIGKLAAHTAVSSCSSFCLGRYWKALPWTE